MIHAPKYELIIGDAKLRTVHQKRKLIKLGIDRLHPINLNVQWFI